MGQAELRLTRVVVFSSKYHKAREDKVVEDECSGVTLMIVEFKLAKEG